MTFRADIQLRHERFILTMISKKFFAWWVATALLIYKYIDSNTWAFLTTAVFGFDTYQKYKGLPNGDTSNNRQGTSTKTSAMVNAATGNAANGAGGIPRTTDKIPIDQDQGD